jgi:biopolymer transport protein ExbD
MKRFIVLSILTIALAYSFTAGAKTPSRGPASEAPAESTSKVLKDTVKKVREDDDGVVILFTKTKGSYYLRRVNVKFDALKVKLDQSLKNKAEISVTYESTELNILEVN